MSFLLLPIVPMEASVLVGTVSPHVYHWVYGDIILVLQGAHQHFMERTVPMSASAITEPTVTTSLGSAHVGQDSQANTASRVSDLSASV